MLLLDEMLPPSLAATLNDAGCDTVAVSANPEWRGATDAEVLELAASSGRIVVTGNIRDFVPLSNVWAAQGRAHPGMLLLSTKTFPMVPERTGRIAAAIVHRHQHDEWPAPGQFEFL
jgi:hypothetical protein